MTKTRIILLVCFIAAFAAGTAAGLVASKKAPPRRPPGPSWLMRELNLTDGQREQMHTIWAEAMEKSGRGYSDARRALSEERDKAIVALLTPDQQPKYQQILAEYNRKMTELSEERNKAFDEAVEQTKRILTPEQAARYEEFLKAQRTVGRDGGRRPPMPWGGMRPHRGPHSMPASAPMPPTMPAPGESQTPQGGE